jgi:hypothetical protein
MAFKNEVVSDADIDRYKLPFPKGGGRWWTRDAERDYYLWGGLVGNPAFDETQEGWFDLYVDGIIHTVVLASEVNLEGDKETPYTMHWKKIVRISPSKEEEANYGYFKILLKEALTAYGLDGETVPGRKETVVRFSFN